MCFLIIWEERDHNKGLLERVDEALAYYFKQYLTEANTVHVSPLWPPEQVEQLQSKLQLHVFVDVPVENHDEIWVRREIELP